MSASCWQEVVTQPKDPVSLLDYWFDITQLLANSDSVAELSATVQPSGENELVIDGGPGDQSIYISSTNLVLWLEGGVPGRGSYLIEVTVSMASGRVFGYRIVVPIISTDAVMPVPEPDDTGPGEPVTCTP